MPNTTRVNGAPKYVSHAFGSPDQPSKDVSGTDASLLVRQGARHQRAAIVRFIILSEAGTISFAFLSAHRTSTASEFRLVLSTRSDTFKLWL